MSTCTVQFPTTIWVASRLAERESCKKMSKSQHQESGPAVLTPRTPRREASLASRVESAVRCHQARVARALEPVHETCHAPSLGASQRRSRRSSRGSREHRGPLRLGQPSRGNPLRQLSRRGRVALPGWRRQADGRATRAPGRCDPVSELVFVHVLHLITCPRTGRVRELDIGENLRLAGAGQELYPFCRNCTHPRGRRICASPSFIT